MSFGFSLGDFVAVIGLANKVRKEFVDAPTQFNHISQELRSLHIVLQDIEVVLPGRELTDQQKAELHNIADGCRNVFRELEETLVKYEQVGVASDGISNKVKRAWKRSRWEPEDIRGFRSRIIANTALLSAFQEKLACQTALATKLGVDRLHEHQDDRERLEKHQTILDWITPIDYATQQSDFIGRRQEGTGQWLLDSIELKTWMNQSNQVLYFFGIPGAGKTICASIVIDELQAKFRNDASVGIAYIYCNFRRNQEQKAVDLLASLLKQFSQGIASLPQTLRKLYEIHRSRRTRPSLDEILQTLQCVVFEYSKSFIIIDALDECQDFGGDRKQFLSGLFSLQVATGLCLLVTSRSIPNIEKEFRARSTRMEIHASDHDLKRYIVGNITRLPAFVLRNADLQKEVESSIIGAVDGMFLLAQLHLDSLVGKRSPKAIRTALAMLPQGSQAYDQAYTEAMVRIEGQIADSQELAKQALLWITCSKRPLTSTELRQALAVEINSSEFDPQNLTEIADVLNVCAGLITVEEDSDIVRLIHYTTQEYFERTWHSWFNYAQKAITETCLTYLSLDVFSSGVCLTDEAFETRLRDNPFYDYAARNWGHHAQTAITDARQAILRFLGKETLLLCSTQAMMAPEYPRRVYSSQNFPKQFTGVHLAAYFGLTDIIIALLDIGHQPDRKDSLGRTPLSLAAKFGHVAVVKLLVERVDADFHDREVQSRISWAARTGNEAVVVLVVDRAEVDMDSKDLVRQTPLSRAAENGHEEVVKLLVDRTDVEADSKDQNGRTPLSWAAQNGHEGVVKLLVDRADVDADSKDRYGRKPLSWAAKNGHEAVVKIFVNRTDVDVDSKDRNDRTPLSRAAKNGYGAVVKLLVDRTDVEADSKDQVGRTPLSWAAEYGHEAVVKLLVDRNNVKANSKAHNGRTPLSYAAERGREAVVKLLVDRSDVEVDSKDRDGRTSLLVGAMIGHIAVVKLLIDRNDVNVNAKDRNGRTPLSWAAQSGNEAVVKLIVEWSNVETDSKHHDGRTPLSWAAATGHETVINLLVDRTDVEADSKDQDGRTPLWWAVNSGHEAVVKLLVNRIDVVADSKNKNGRTPLSRAAENGHEKVVKLLVDRTDVDADSKDQDGRTPFSWAARNGNEGVVTLLIDRTDVEADSKDLNSRTPLLLAAAWGHERVVNLLVNRIDVVADSKNRNGRTPLSRAAENGHEEVVKLLVDRADVEADSKDQNGRTPLSYAAQNGHDEVVKLLFNRTDIEANSKDWDGRTALSWAAQKNHERVVKLLIDRPGVDVDSKDQNGWTPFSWAVQNGFWNQGVVKLLIDRTDVETDSKDQNGRTPLSLAAACGIEWVVQLLADRTDVDADSKDQDGRTPLSWAAQNGQEEVVKLLINRSDVEADSKDLNSRTPLIWATSKDLESKLHPLHLFAFEGRWAVAELLGKKVDSNSRESDYCEEC